MKLHTYLHQLSEPCPTWLKDFQPGDSFDRHQFFNSRIVYYPGSGNDGHAIKCFGSSHSAHCFIYVDYMVKQSQVKAELSHSSPHNSRSVRGYHSLARLPLQLTDLVSPSWRAHTVTPQNPFQDSLVGPYGFLEILERYGDLDDTHGAHRLAILFLGADGIASYDALFCQQNGVPPPFSVLIQDHGFGGNYDTFGGDGLLASVAMQCRVFPQFLLVADGTKPWEGYERCINAAGDIGGMHKSERFLFALKTET